MVHRKFKTKLEEKLYYVRKGNTESISMYKSFLKQDMERVKDDKEELAQLRYEKREYLDKGKIPPKRRSLSSSRNYECGPIGGPGNWIGGARFDDDGLPAWD